jgi:hypothetical protein
MADNFFSFDDSKLRSQFGKLGDSLSKKLKPQMKSKMTKAVQMVYDTARTPRPMARALLGRKSTGVSSTAARYGVPVQTGNLRDSIKKKITETSTGIAGKIYVDRAQAPYAMRVEYGFVGEDSAGRTYRQLPRPFMRPALSRNLQAINRLFKS